MLPVNNPALNSLWLDLQLGSSIFISIFIFLEPHLFPRFFDEDSLTFVPALHNVPVEPRSVDAGDLSLSPSFVLRRIDMTVTVLPGPAGRPQLLAREEVTPVVGLEAPAIFLETLAAAIR